MNPLITGMMLMKKKRDMELKGVQIALDNLNNFYSTFLQECSDLTEVESKASFGALIEVYIFKSYEILEWSMDKMRVLARISDRIEVLTYAKDLGNDEYEIHSELLTKEAL